MNGRRRQRLSDEPGRLRWRMCKLIERAKPGWKISPYDLWEQKGWYRANAVRDGGASWGGNGADEHGRAVSFSAWDTMTLCARFGILFSDNNRDSQAGAGTWDISANR